MRYKRVAKKVLRAVGLRKPPPRWVVAVDQPATPEPLRSFGLFAIVATWMEADVIEATVRNAFAQGCDRVILVDNDSPDDTVAVAKLAGAELARSFTTAQLDEVLKIRLLNQTVREVSDQDGRDHIWWLWLDADEFVHGPASLTLREYLAGLDRQYRIVGSRYFNHFPDRAPESVPGIHPLDLQPLCQEKSGNLCALGHRKHQIQRYDREGPYITSSTGYHAARAVETLLEPKVAVFTHHFPYRLEQVTRARFDALCGRFETGPARVEMFDRQVIHNAGTVSDMSKRYRTLDSVYRQDWAQVENLRRSGPAIGVEPEPWTTLVDADDAKTVRWYEPEQSAATIAKERTSA